MIRSASWKLTLVALILLHLDVVSSGGGVTLHGSETVDRNIDVNKNNDDGYDACDPNNEILPSPGDYGHCVVGRDGAIYPRKQVNIRLCSCHYWTAKELYFYFCLLLFFSYQLFPLTFFVLVVP